MAPAGFEPAKTLSQRILSPPHLAALLRRRKRKANVTIFKTAHQNRQILSPRISKKPCLFESQKSIDFLIWPLCYGAARRTFKHRKSFARNPLALARVRRARISECAQEPRVTFTWRYHSTPPCFSRWFLTRRYLNLLLFDHIYPNGQKIVIDSYHFVFGAALLSSLARSFTMSSSSFSARQTFATILPTFFRRKNPSHSSTYLIRLSSSKSSSDGYAISYPFSPAFDIKSYSSLEATFSDFVPCSRR